MLLDARVSDHPSNGYLEVWGYSLYSRPYYRLWWRFFFRPRIPLTIAA